VLTIGVVANCFQISQDSIEIPTSYADSGLYRFAHVFQPQDSIEKIFQSVLPVVLDCVNGVNGAIVVGLLQRFLKVFVDHASCMCVSYPGVWTSWHREDTND
jgi:hypothetical protein